MMEACVGVDYQRMEEVLQPLLGQHAAVTCCSTDGELSMLEPIERMAIQGAIPRRQKEFAAGRAAARKAMLRLGRSAVAIPMKDDRSPQWPADLVGSISHSHAACVSVVAIKTRWKAVGVDVEPDQDLPRELWSLIGLPSELRRAAALPQDLQARWMMRVFCAKEAYYKYMFPQLMRVLDFHEAEIVMDATLEGTEFQVHPHHSENSHNLPKQLSGHLLAYQGQVISLIIH
jgi:enterobactin synthetase component D